MWSVRLRSAVWLQWQRRCRGAGGSVTSAQHLSSIANQQAQSPHPALTVADAIRPHPDRANEDEPALVRGWVRSVRDHKDVTFVEVNDGSCLSNLQVVLSRNASDEVGGGERDDRRLEEEGASSDLALSTGCSVEVYGKLVPSPRDETRFELAVEKSGIKVLGASDAADAGEERKPYPLQKKRHTLEFLREQIPHLRPRSNTIGAAMRVRSCAGEVVGLAFLSAFLSFSSSLYRSS